jgi:hypothetical protein
MSKLIQRFTASFPEVGQVVSVQIPTWCEEVALRVYDKYNPPMPPPVPELVIVTVAGDPPSAPPTYITRNFMLVPDSQALPDTFLKYIATIPFGPDKQIVDLIEISLA